MARKLKSDPRLMLFGLPRFCDALPQSKDGHVARR